MVRVLWSPIALERMQLVQYHYHDSKYGQTLWAIDTKNYILLTNNHVDLIQDAYSTHLAISALFEEG